MDWQPATSRRLSGSGKKLKAKCPNRKVYCPSRFAVLDELPAEGVEHVKGRFASAGDQQTDVSGLMNPDKRKRPLYTVGTRLSSLSPPRPEPKLMVISVPGIAVEPASGTSGRERVLSLGTPREPAILFRDEPPSQMDTQTMESTLSLRLSPPPPPPPVALSGASSGRSQGLSVAEVGSASLGPEFTPPLLPVASAEPVVGSGSRLSPLHPYEDPSVEL